MVVYSFLTVSERSAFLRIINELCREHEKNPIINVNGKKIEINFNGDDAFAAIVDSYFRHTWYEPVSANVRYLV